MKKQEELKKLADLMRLRSQLDKDEFTMRMAEIKKNLDLYDKEDNDE